MICASRPNFYKANSSLSEIFLPVSLNDLCFPSQFLQHNLTIKWNTPYMLFSLNCGSRPNFYKANSSLSGLLWLCVVSGLMQVADPAHGSSRSRSATQRVRCRLFLNLCGKPAFDQGGTPKIPNFLSAAVKPFAVYWFWCIFLALPLAPPVFFWWSRGAV